MNITTNRTLNTKDKERLKQEFKKTRDNYLKEVNNLRKSTKNP